MAQRLTPGMPSPLIKRGRGRPRKDGKPPRQHGGPLTPTTQLHDDPPPQPRGYGRNVTDATRLEFLERGRLAYLEAERKKQDYQSAWRIYSTIVKEARKCGATEIAWTLEAIRRDPFEVEREIEERIRMAQIANIPIGTQFDMFEKTKVQKQQEKLHLNFPTDAVPPPEAVTVSAAGEIIPPEPKPDEPDEGDDDDDDEDEEEEAPQTAKAGNEVLEPTEEEASAFLQGDRSRQLERAITANPYDDTTSLHNAWTRGWRTRDMAKAQEAAQRRQ